MEWNTLTVSVAFLMLAYLTAITSYTLWCISRTWIAIATLNNNLTLLRDVVNGHTNLLHRIEAWQVESNEKITDVQKRLEKAGA